MVAGRSEWWRTRDGRRAWWETPYVYGAVGLASWTAAIVPDPWSWLILAATVGVMVLGCVLWFVAVRRRRRAAVEATWNKGGRWRAFESADAWHASLSADGDSLPATVMHDLEARLCGTRGVVILDKSADRHRAACAAAIASLWPAARVFVPTVENVAEMVHADRVPGHIWLDDVARLFDAGLPEDWLFLLLERAHVFGILDPSRLPRIPAAQLPAPRFLDRVRFARDGSIIPEDPSIYEEPPRPVTSYAWERHMARSAALLQPTATGGFRPADDVETRAAGLRPIPTSVWMGEALKLVIPKEQLQLADAARANGAYEAAFMIRRYVRQMHFPASTMWRW